MRRVRGMRLLLLMAALAVGAACAHAPPATGNRDPNAPLDVDNPEQNCNLSNTVDCRPSAD
jgi:hypothetical protein